MSKNEIPKIVLIGTCVDNEIGIRDWLGRGKNPVLQVTNGFGSFQAGISHLSCAKELPDIVYIENTTCMASSDIERGCAKLTDVLVQSCKDQELPVIILTDEIGRDTDHLFTDKGITIFRGDVFQWADSIPDPAQALS